MPRSRGGCAFGGSSRRGARISRQSTHSCSSQRPRAARSQPHSPLQLPDRPVMAVSWTSALHPPVQPATPVGGCVGRPRASHGSSRLAEGKAGPRADDMADEKRICAIPIVSISLFDSCVEYVRRNGPVLTVLSTVFTAVRFSIMYICLEFVALPLVGTRTQESQDSTLPITPSRSSV